MREEMANKIGLPESRVQVKNYNSLCFKNEYSFLIVYIHDFI